MTKQSPLSGLSAARVSQLPLFWIAAVILGALLVWQLVRLILLLISPLTPVGGWQPRQAQIMPVDQREAILSTYNPFSGTSRADIAAEKSVPGRVTALDLVLYGIRIGSTNDQGSAIIAGSDGVQQNYLVGEEVLPGVKLASVAFDHVVLERSGARESLFIDQSDNITPVGGDAGDTSAPDAPIDTVELTTETMPEMGEGIAFIPRLDEGRVTGLTLTPKQDGKIFEQYGFRQGDVIVEYDGRNVSSAKDVDTLLAKVKPGSRFSVMVERGANVVPIAIIIPEN